jgi:putative colanic acid biosynthesis UDP-glucose lipid carrier transferase
MSNQGMIRPNQGSFNFIYRLIDLLIILCGLSLAVTFYNVDFTYLYVSIGLISFVLFMLCSESLGLYRSWRTSSLMEMLLTTSLTWWLSTLIVLLK